MKNAVREGHSVPPNKRLITIKRNHELKEILY